MPNRFTEEKTERKSPGKMMRDFWRTAKKQFFYALPEIILFLALYYMVLLLFGTRYVMTVSVVTVVFKVNYRKQKPWPELFRTAGKHLLLCGLAFVAGLHLTAALVLNFAVPFWLIFITTSQFNQTAYFSELMTFVFLQLLPLNLTEKLIQAEALCFCLGCFLLAVWIWRRVHPAGRGWTDGQKTLHLLAACLRQFREDNADGQQLQQLFGTEDRLFLEAYQKSGKKEVVTPAGKAAYLFGLMCQRGSYICTHFPEYFRSEELGAAEALLLRKTADYFARAASVPFWKEEERKWLGREGEGLRKQAAEQAKVTERSGKKQAGRGEASDREKARPQDQTVQIRQEFYAALQGLIRPFLWTLRIQEEQEAGRQKTVWSLPEYRKPAGKLRYQLRPDVFEMRFALRMSTVLVISFAYVLLSGAEHAYWLPLHAMLLLRPMHEESAYRMRNRILGTAAGCLILSLILPWLPGTAGHIALASVMAVCMYTATPGTVIHGVCVTAFALSMTTLALRESAALGLRMFYVAAAVLLVLLISRFYFSMSRQHQYQYNYQMIFHMQHRYLHILSQSAASRVDSGTVCDTVIQCHLMYGQSLRYLQENRDADGEYERRLLEISLDMTDIMDQLLYLVNVERRGERVREMLEHYVFYADYVLTQIQKMLNLRPEQSFEGTAGIRLERNVEGDPEMSALLMRYAKNMSQLFLAVSERRS